MRFHIANTIPTAVIWAYRKLATFAIISSVTCASAVYTNSKTRAADSFFVYRAGIDAAGELISKTENVNYGMVYLYEMLNPDMLYAKSL